MSSKSVKLKKPSKTTKEAPDSRKALHQLESKRAQKTKGLVVHRSFRKTKRVKLDNSQLDSPWRVLRDSGKFVRAHKRRLFWLLLSYVPLIVLVARDPINSQVDSILASNIILVVGLASIWLIRHLDAHEAVRVKQAYYSGMTPLIPFLLVILVFGLQLVFAGLGLALFQWSQFSGAAITRSETIFAGVLAALVAYPTFYWVPGTIFGMYAVTLPGMAPKQALKIGRKLADGRRWFIYQRFILLLMLAAAIILPLYLLFIKLEWNAYIMDMLVITIVSLVPFMHVYMYKVYKSLIA